MMACRAGREPTGLHHSCGCGYLVGQGEPALVSAWFATDSAPPRSPSSRSASPAPGSRPGHDAWLVRQGSPTLSARRQPRDEDRSVAGTASHPRERRRCLRIPWRRRSRTLQAAAPHARCAEPPAQPRRPRAGLRCAPPCRCGHPVEADCETPSASRCCSVNGRGCARRGPRPGRSLGRTTPCWGPCASGKG